MKKFVFLYYGYETPTQEIMDAWNNWFASLGDKLVENCGPFGPGREITHTETRELPTGVEALTGYSIIRTDDMEHAVSIAKGCPIITSIQVYEVRSM
jgi:hypothetical protein